MPGCRYLTDDEVRRILNVPCRSLRDFRDRLLFILGICTGFRIAELLSIKFDSIWDFNNSCVKSELKVEAKNMKGKKSSRVVPLGNLIALEIKNYVLRSILRINRNAYVFPGSDPSKPMSTKTGSRAILKLFIDASISVKNDKRLGSHSLRKTFAKNIRDVVGNDIVELQRCLGHKNINSTTAYIEDCKPEREEMIRTLYKKLTEEEEAKLQEEEEVEYVDFT